MAGFLFWLVGLLLLFLGGKGGQGGLFCFLLFVLTILLLETNLTLVPMNVCIFCFLTKVLLSQSIRSLTKSKI